MDLSPRRPAGCSAGAAGGGPREPQGIGFAPAECSQELTGCHPSVSRGSNEIIPKARSRGEGKQTSPKGSPLRRLQGSLPRRRLHAAARGGGQAPRLCRGGQAPHRLCRARQSLCHIMKGRGARGAAGTPRRAGADAGGTRRFPMLNSFVLNSLTYPRC